MSYKQLIRKAAKFILASQPDKYTKVEVAQINYGGILSGKTVVITGGSRGLGYYMAKKCIAEGAEVVISGRKKEALEKTAQFLGDRCHTIVFDVTDIAHCTDFLKEAEAVLGRKIDNLISNAGVSFHENHFTNVTVEGFDKQFNTNFRAGYFLSKAFLERKMTEEDPSGQLLLIS